MQNVVQPEMIEVKKEIIDPSFEPQDSELNYNEEYNNEYVDQNGEYVDQSGEYLDQSGEYLYQSGEYLDQSGEYVDQSGEYLDQSGEYLDQSGEYVDQSGEYVETDQNYYETGEQPEISNFCESKMEEIQGNVKLSEDAIIPAAQIKQEVLEDQEAYFQPELKPKIEPLDYNIQGELSNFEQQDPNLKGPSNKKIVPKLDKDGKKMFPCELCDKSYGRRTDLRGHIATVHEGVKPATCEICGKQFATRRSDLKR